MELFEGLGLEAFELAADRELLDVTEMVDEQLPGQVVHFMLGGPGEKALEPAGPWLITMFDGTIAQCSETNTGWVWPVRSSK